MLEFFVKVKQKTHFENQCMFQMKVVYSIENVEILQKISTIANLAHA